MPKLTLRRLIALNVVFDIIAIAIWVALPVTREKLPIDYTIVIAEAAIAAGLFNVVLFGLTRKQRWAPILAIVITVIQRIFGTVIFFPSPAIAVTAIWSALIVYSAYKIAKTANKETNQNQPFLW